MTELRKVALDSFDKNASRYHQGVYQKKRLEMLNKLNIQLNVLFVGQLKNLHKKAVTTFDENLKLELKKPNYNFAVSVESCLKDAQDLFLNGAKALLLPDTDWSYTNELNILEEEFSEVATKARTDEFKKMTKNLTVSNIYWLYL